MRAADHGGLDRVQARQLCSAISQLAECLLHQISETERESTRAVHAESEAQKYYEKCVEQESLRGYCKRCYDGLETE